MRDSYLALAILLIPSRRPAEGHELGPPLRVWDIPSNVGQERLGSHVQCVAQRTLGHTN